MSIKVELTKPQLQELLKLATGRNDIKAQYNVTNRRYSNRHGDVEINYKGIQGEFAVAKVFGVDIDRTITPSGDSKGRDLRIDDLDVQVKVNNYKNGDLYFNSLAHFQADIAILVIYLKEGLLEIKGWANKSWFEKRHTTKMSFAPSNCPFASLD